jgi:hypothetical protein
MEYLTEWPPPPTPPQCNCDAGESTLPPSKRPRRSDDVDDFIPAIKLISSWWRKSGERTAELGVQSKSPLALIEAICRRDDAKNFLKGHIEKLASSERGQPPNDRNTFTIATIHHLLRDDENALRSIEKCLDIRGLRHLHDVSDISSNLSYVKELSNVDREVLRVATIAHLQMKALQIEDRSSSDNISDIPWTAVDVVRAKDLTVESFRDMYARPKRPVVIEGLELTKHPWTLNHVQNVAGHHKVSLRYAKPDSTEWARLETCGGGGTDKQQTLHEFIANIKEGKEREGYLFDWSLPLFCPELHSEISIPIYFKEDYLKKGESFYSSSWPSLFVSPEGTISDLHIDAFGSNFWMALFSGSKKWTFFRPQVSSQLRPRFIDSFDPVFDIDLTTASGQKVAIGLGPATVVLQPGQVLFVPAGSPHRVENLESSVAVSGNFVDDSNISEAVVHLQRNALLDPRAGELLEYWLGKGLIK